MVKSKPSRTSEGNELKILIGGNKGQSPNTKKYRGKKTLNKTGLEPEAETDFQGRCTDLEGYVFYLGPRAPKELER